MLLLTKDERKSVLFYIFFFIYKPPISQVERTKVENSPIPICKLPLAGQVVDRVLAVNSALPEECDAAVL